VTTTIEIWGDSHLDEIAGIGARYALTYEANFRHDVQISENNAEAGSWVLKWLSGYAEKDKDHADILVVSSGFNDAVMVSYGLLSQNQVRASWELLVSLAKSRNQKVIWVPTNYKYGRAATEFKDTELLNMLPHCIGADVLDWNPTEDQMCGDKVHYTYDAYHDLAKRILDKASGMGPEKRIDSPSQK